MTLEEIDLMDTRHFVEDDPRKVFKLMRAEAPVYWHERKPGQGFWCLTRYEDIVRVYRDLVTFTSAKGLTLDFVGRTSHPIAQKMMTVTDPPMHMQIRRLVSADFLPRAIDAVIPRIHKVADRVIDGVIERGECDFVYEIAGKIPAAVLSEMMDLPDCDAAFLEKVADDIMCSDDPAVNLGRPVAEVAGAARDRFADYCKDLVEERRKSTRDDLVSKLARGRIEIENRPISAVEIIANMLNLVLGGHETTRNAASGGLMLFLSNPERRAQFESEPGSPLLANEILRYVCPIYHVKRETTRDTVIRGQAIPEGEKVVLWLLSANFDEAQFPDAESFDHRRGPNQHLALGMGEHACLGMHLAQLELRIMFEHITRRLGDIEMAAPAEMLRTNARFAVKRLPIRFKPRTARSLQ